MSPQSNGRVERSVQEVKVRIQRALTGAGLGPEYWPAACRFVHHERRRLAKPKPQKVPQRVRKAQQFVGELLWLSTRTRPEIAFSHFCGKRSSTRSLSTMSGR